MNAQRYRSEKVEAALRSLAAQNASASASEGIESQLLAEFDRRAQRSPQRLQWRLGAGAAALAASLTAAIFILHRPVPSPQSSDQPFAMVPYVAPPGPYERLEMVRRDVPVSLLLATGFDVHLPGSQVAVAADVLIGQDGRVLAIRPETYQ